MKIRFIIITFCSIIFSCTQKNYNKKDFNGFYVGNEFYITDTIEIINDSIYYHYGTLFNNSRKFSDTSTWILDKNELVFYDFCFYQNPDAPINDTSLTRITGVWVTQFYEKNEIIHLNISRDFPLFYTKINSY